MSNKTIALLLAALMVTVAGIGIVNAETQYTAGDWYNQMSEHMANFMGRGTGDGMMGGYGSGYGMMNGHDGYGMMNGHDGYGMMNGHDGYGMMSSSGHDACLTDLDAASTNGTAPELVVKTAADALVIAKENINSNVKVENIKSMGRFWVVYYTNGDIIESVRIDAFTGEVVDETTDFAQYRLGRQGGYGRGSGVSGGMMYKR